MTAAAAYEILGYIASGLIVISITQKAIFRLRIIGLAGSLSFLIYGLLIGAFPIVLVNLAATAIHLYYLRKLTRDSAEVFRALPVRGDSAYLQAFVAYYDEEIRARFQPEFVFEHSPDLITAFVLRDIVPAGLFIGRRLGDGTVEALLDYASPEYRDFRIAEFLFSNKAGLFGPTDRTIISRTPAVEHAVYLRRIGFVESAAEPNLFELTLPPVPVTPGATA